MQSPVKCLLVDDLDDNLLALSALLRRDGVELFQANSASQALELLLAHDFALAILDVQMPEMDGFELAELMRGSERTRQIPIIFVTAGSRDQRRLFKGYDTGAVDFLYKPIEPHILISKADIFFQLYRQKIQLAQQLQERTETLRLNEMFMAVLGHDLRNPLHAMITSAQVLQHSTDPEVVQAVAERLLNSGKWMSRMIEDLLDLARARLAGGITLEPQRVDLEALIQRVLAQQRAAFPERQIDLSARGDLHGEWDPDRLTQIASNLIGNALQHGHNGTPVRIELDGDDPHSVLLVIANAGHIAPALLPHIFDPFRGGQRHSSRNEGLGLGLYIVQQIVQAHRGQVEVESAPGQMTYFRVAMPRRASSHNTVIG